PLYSPDLNPTKHIWQKLRILLQIHHPTIKHLPERPKVIKPALAIPHTTMWERIKEHEFWTMCCSMCTQVQAVIDAKGWYTKY
ncbi:hypothetical protein DFH27DRAFT_488360, partial [Peziza echinospora]